MQIRHTVIVESNTPVRDTYMLNIRFLCWLAALWLLTTASGITQERPPVESANAGLEPAKILSANSKTSVLKDHPSWTSVPRYLIGGVLHQVKPFSGTTLELEVIEGGVLFIVAPRALSKLEKNAIENVKLQSVDDILKLGFKSIGNLPEYKHRNKSVAQYLLRKTVKKGERLSIKTHADLPPTAIIPDVKNLAAAMKPLKGNREMIPPLQNWDYEPIDLLKQVDNFDGVYRQGVWTFCDKGLKALGSLDNTKLMGFSFPVGESLPPEYDMEFVVERLSGKSALRIGYVSGAAQGVVRIDSVKDGSGIEYLDGETPNETFQKQPIFNGQGPCWITIKVRVDGIEVLANGNRVVDYEGDIRRIGTQKDWENLRFYRDPFLLFNNADYLIRSAKIFPMRSGPEVKEWIKTFRPAFRRWTLTQGNSKETSDLRYEAFDSNRVIVAMRNGETHFIDINFLSDFDRMYVRSQNGEGNGESDLPEDVVKKLKAATVYVRSYGISKVVNRSVGVLFHKEGNVGYIALSRLAVYHWESGPAPELDGRVEVNFHFGEEREFALDAEIMYRGGDLIDRMVEDLAVLKVVSDDLPEPIDLFDSNDVNEEMTSYVVTHEAWNVFGKEIPESKKKAVVLKVPVRPHIDRYFFGRKIVRFQSQLDCTPGGAVVDKSGKVLGLMFDSRGAAHSAQSILYKFRVRSDAPHWGLLKRIGNRGEFLMWNTWIAPPPHPKSIILMLTEANRAELPNGRPLDGDWKPFSTTGQSFPMKLHGNMLVGTFKADLTKRYVMQYRFVTHEGKEQWSRIIYVDLNPPSPLDDLLVRTLTLPEQPGAIRTFAEPVNVDRLAVLGEVDRSEVAGATRLDFKDPTGAEWVDEGRTLIVLEKGGRIAKLSLPEFRIVKELQIPSTNCAELALSKAGIVVRLGDKQQTLVINPNTLKVERSIATPFPIQLTASPNSNIGFSLGADRHLYALDFRKGNIRRKYNQATGYRDWTLGSGKDAIPPLAIEDIAMTPDGKYLFAHDKQRVYRYSVKGEQLRYEEGTQPLVSHALELVVGPGSKGVALTSPVGNFSAVSFPDHEGTLHFATNDLKTPTRSIPSTAIIFAFHNSGRWIYESNRDKGVVLRDEVGKTVSELTLLDNTSKTMFLRPYPIGNRVLVNRNGNLFFVDFGNE